MSEVLLANTCTLTSSAHFIASQTNRAPAIILIHELGNMRHKSYNKDKWVCSTLTLPDIHNNLFCLDDTKTNKKLKKLTLNGTDLPNTFLSFYFPLWIAFKGRASSMYFVLNPISGKSRCIPWPPPVPHMCYGAYMCGMFFHPLASEFKLIFVHREYTKVSCWYYVYGSATNCWRRINTTPLFFW
ncbi:hypothetical protein Leryth_013173, partial [Lithospermum erythrorhizon]